jgi:hypothetical protein
MSNVLLSSWIDAVASARLPLGAPKVIIQRTELVETDSILGAWENQSFPSKSVAVINVRPITHLAEIERRELMLAIAAERATEISCSAYDHQTLCKQLGCLSSNIASIPERWRVLAIRFDLLHLPYAGLEDRTRCKICSGAIPTGSHYLPEHGSPRLDLHHECGNYVQTVLLPRHRAAMAARTAK